MTIATNPLDTYRLTTFERMACDVLLMERGLKAALRKAEKYQARHMLKSVRLQLFLSLNHKSVRNNPRLWAAVNGVFADLDNLAAVSIFSPSK